MAHPQPADAPPADRQVQLYAIWDAEMRARLRPLATDEVIAEHARNPLGQHTEPLARLLNYFRRVPQAGKYVIVNTQPHREWQIAILSGRRGVPPAPIPGAVYSSWETAIHGVFVRRVEDLKRG